jgi:hypothetical protein
LYPFVELKLSIPSLPGALKWSHRTDLSLDFDEDAVWHTHFRSPFSLQDSLENQLHLEVSFLDKQLSPRHGSRTGSIEETEDEREKKKVTVARVELADCALIFKKKMKWIQLVGVFPSSPEVKGVEGGSRRYGGMYTVTMRYNPHAAPTAATTERRSPRPSLPSSSPRPIVEQVVSSSEGGGGMDADPDPLVAFTDEAVTEGEGEGGTWPTEYEYDSYYHEGGYYDHHTHAYLGNAYDHDTAQYYHDETLLLPQEGQEGEAQPWEEHEQEGGGEFCQD